MERDRLKRLQEAEERAEKYRQMITIAKEIKFEIIDATKGMESSYEEL